MDQQRAPLRPPFDDMDLDDAPGLTESDEAALETIRRQLEEEYPAADVTPSPPDEPAAVLPAPRAGIAWRWPFLAALVTFAAVGGGLVGAALTARVLGEPGATAASHVLRDPPAALHGAVLVTRHEAETAIPVVHAQQDPGPAATAPVAPAPDRAQRVALPPRRPSAVTPPAPVETTPAAENAASPATRSDAASERPSSPRSSRPNGTSSMAGPEPQTWSDPFRPLSAETAAHAEVAKVAFRSSTASPVPAPAPPPSAPPLPAPRTVTAARGASPDPSVSPAHPAQTPGASREEGVLTTIREDWKTVRSGFASAPDDFRRAWRSLTRDVKELLDR